MAFKKKTLKQGYFTPKFPDKYIITEKSITKGNGIRYMSGWERMFFDFCDLNPNVLSWNSEGIQIPYISPLDNRQHTYYPDVYLEVRRADGSVEKSLVEIKPNAERMPPKEPKKKTEKSKARYMKQCQTFLVNQAKWEQAERFCNDNGITWKIMDEYSLGIKKQPKK